MLREDKAFTDVTLVCEDGQQLEAHKIILAATSPVFQKILEGNKHPHPLIYLRRVHFQQLVHIFDFLYHGEANVHQKDLESFLALAEELKLKGLKDKNVDGKKKFTSDSKCPTNDTIEAETLNPIAVVSFEDPTPKTKVPEESLPKPLRIKSDDGLLTLDEMVSSLMEKSENMISNGKGKQGGMPQQKRAFVCKVCGKEGQSGNIRSHIEANHINGISVPCANCDKNFSTRKALQKHKNRHHLIGDVENQSRDTI